MILNKTDMFIILFNNYNLYNGSLFNCLDFFLSSRHLGIDCKLVIKNYNKEDLIRISNYKYISEVLSFYNDIEEYDLESVDKYENFVIFDYSTLKSILLFKKNIIYVNNSIGNIDNIFLKKNKEVFKNRLIIFNEMPFFDRFGSEYIYDYSRYTCKVGLLIFDKDRLTRNNDFGYRLASCICSDRVRFNFIYGKYVDELSINEFKFNSFYYRKNLLEHIGRLILFRSLGNIDRKPNLPIECGYLGIPVSYFSYMEDNLDDGAYFRFRDVENMNLEKYFITKSDLIYQYFV